MANVGLDKLKETTFYALNSFFFAFLPKLRPETTHLFLSSFSSSLFALKKKEKMKNPTPIFLPLKTLMSDSALKTLFPGAQQGALYYYSEVSFRISQKAIMHLLLITNDSLWHCTWAEKSDRLMTNESRDILITIWTVRWGTVSFFQLENYIQQL